MSIEDDSPDININSILLPKLSNIIYKVNNQISSGNIQDIAAMSKEHSKDIREALLTLTEEKRNSSLYPSLQNLLMIFSYFDFFIAHSDDFRYMFKIKNELIAKYALKLDLSQSFLNSASNLKDSIVNSLEKIKQDLSLCDIKSALNKIKDLLCIFEQKHFELISFEPLLDYYKDIYIQLGYVLDNLSRITEDDTKIDAVILLAYMNEDFANKIKECRTTFEFIEKGFKQSNPSMSARNNMLVLTSQIIGIIGGDEKLILNQYNKNNFHSIVCAHVFYRFYYHNFTAQLVKDLKDNCQNDQLNSLLLEMLSPIDNKGSKLFEFIQKLKGNFPFILRFHMYNILQFLDMINEDNAKEEYLFLFNNLIEIGTSFEIFSRYMFGFIGDDHTTELILSDYSIKCVCRLTEGLDVANEDIDVIIGEIDSIKKEVRTFKFGEKILKKINEILFWKYLEVQLYAKAIDVYIENYISSIEEKKNEAESSLFLYKDSIMTEKTCEFDHILFLLFSNPNHEILALIRQSLADKQFLPPKVEFAVKYIDFLNNMSNIDQKEKNLDDIGEDACCGFINDFFDYCFVVKKCPTVMWVNVLKEIQKVYQKNEEKLDNYSMINRDKVRTAWDNLMLYEQTIKRKVFNLIKEKENFEKDFDDVSNFLFDLKSHIL